MEIDEIKIDEIIKAADAWVEENYPKETDTVDKLVRAVAKRAFFIGAIKMTSYGQFI